eukprot:4227829-Alexandrium_andersonii.AAC.1
MQPKQHRGQFAGLEPKATEARTHARTHARTDACALEGQRTTRPARGSSFLRHPQDDHRQIAGAPTGAQHGVMTPSALANSYTRTCEAVTEQNGRRGPATAYE